ncbi:hypothetical protein DFJ73DRAFT_764028 [Zopfochytrium polystomum]|nr:hypothetical protein DFJ73DRAFT_764028 [Zopfochytrium polystomum]
MLGAFTNTSTLSPPRSPSRASNSSQSSVRSTSSVYSVHAPSASTKALTNAKRASIHSSTTIPSVGITDIDVSTTGPRMHHGFQQFPADLAAAVAAIKSATPDAAGPAFIDPRTAGPRLSPHPSSYADRDRTSLRPPRSPSRVSIASASSSRSARSTRSVSSVYSVHAPSASTQSLTAAKRASLLASAEPAAEIDVSTTGPRMHHGFQRSVEELAGRVAAAKLGGGGGEVTFVDPKTAGPRFKAATAPRSPEVKQSSVEILVSSADV